MIKVNKSEADGYKLIDICVKKIKNTPNRKYALKDASI